MLFPTITEQVAASIRQDLLNGRWLGTLPGRHQLSRDLEVNHKTVDAALALLEDEGILVNQGVGRKRRILIPEGGIQTPKLRVAFLHYTQQEQPDQWILDMQQRLLYLGHKPFSANNTLKGLGMDPGRIARLVKRTPADAWLVSAASKEVLEWFSQQETPAFSLFGVRSGIPMAGTGPDKSMPIAELTRRLVGLGHGRISFICRRQIRLPQPSQGILSFIKELEAAGIEPGPFNLPDWEENAGGFRQCLDSLFKVTPPTALILDEPYLFHGAFHHLVRNGLRVPEDVSLICTDPDPGFAWCSPSVAHISWDTSQAVRRILRWLNNVAAGKDDRRQTYTKAVYVEGGTVAPVPKK